MTSQAEAVYYPRMAQAISDRYLNLIVMPTERCNFRCIYCYESFRIGKMRPSVIRGLKNLIGQRFPELDFLTLSWFGGEPLLAMDVIQEISEYVLSLSRIYPRVRYRGDITTNAYFITAAIFRKLLDWHVRSYQISFDGTKKFHDHRRVLANGTGTFDRLWANLRRMKAFPDDFAVTVRLHLDRDNYSNASDFLAIFKSEFGKDSRFTLYVRELSQLKDPKVCPLNVFTLHEAMDTIERVRACAKTEGLRIRVPERKNHVCEAACYAAKLNSFVIRANGHISKCTVALDSDINDVGFLDDNGTMSFDRKKIMRWVRGLGSGDVTELGCPMIGVE